MDYVVTGTAAFGEKAIAEAAVVAAMYGSEVHLAASTGVGEKPVAYVRAPSPEELVLDAKASYVHFTSNETINGVQFANEPGEAFPDFAGLPIVCDMSSDFIWRPIDVGRFDFIYAGAQKNIGPSGLVIAIARKDFVARGRKDIPKIFQYRAFVEANSLLNTPPTFAIYLVRNVLQWVKGEGGLEALEKRNREKGRLLYAAVDASGGFFACPVEPRSRSVMNVVFRLPTRRTSKPQASPRSKSGEDRRHSRAPLGRAGSASRSTTRCPSSGYTRSSTSCRPSPARTAEREAHRPSASLLLFCRERACSSASPTSALTRSPRAHWSALTRRRARGARASFVRRPR